MLNTNRFLMTHLGFMLQAIVGTGTWVDGLALTATTPTANLTVTVGPGSITSLTVVDQNAYGSLTSDSSDALMKMGVNLTSTSFTFTPPGTAGQSQVFLIEASFAETDTVPLVLPYYNSANPSQPYLGPANSGASQNTQRQQRVSLQVKAGAAATTGSQTAPAVDSGWTALYLITVANGQTQITQSACNSAGVGNLPSIPAKIGQLRRRLSANTTIYVATTGNDSNDGMTTSTPFLTLQKAWNYVCNSLDLNGYNVTIAIGPGTFSGALVSSGTPVGVAANNGVTIQGYTSNAFTTPATTSTVSGGSNPTISTTGATCLSFYGSNGALTVAGIALTSATSGNLILSSGATQLTLGAGVTLGASAGSQLVANTGGLIQASAALTFAGSAVNALSVFEGGNIVVSGYSHVTSGTIAYSGAFASAADSGSNIVATGATFSGGTVTGVRYAVSRNATINTNGGGANYFPGNSAGTGTNAGTSPYGLYV